MPNELIAEYLTRKAEDVLSNNKDYPYALVVVMNTEVKVFRGNLEQGRKTILSVLNKSI